MNIDETVGQYIDLRNQVADKKKEFEAFKKECEEDMKLLEAEILEVSNVTGVESFKTPHGTAYRTTKTYAKVFDAEARINYAKETGDFGLFTSHVAKKHAMELLDDGMDPSIFGVDVETEAVIQFRKA